MSDAWDCHVHVFGDPARFPLAPDRRYTPGEAGVDRLRTHLTSVGATRAVLVQPTVYGADHACLLDVLDDLGPAAVGVAAWHAGATPPAHPRLRGLRLDLRGPWPETRAAPLHSAADAARTRGWHLELQVSPASLAPLAREVAALGTPVVLDHLAGVPTGEDAATLLALLDQPEIFVKLSALERAPGKAALALAQLLAHRAPDRLLWGSDWPHTPLHPAAKARLTALPFRAVDDPAALRALGRELGEALATARGATPSRLYGRPSP